MPKPGDGQALKPGTRLDVYEVEEVLGTGGFGITYRARDANLHCDVAIKEYFPGHLAVRDPERRTLVPRSSDQQQTYAWGLKRFLDEARTLARFKEPGIVRVNRLFEANGTAYLVMDYVEGVSLESRLRQHGLLDEEAVTAILRPLLEGLRALHAQNILHRDIKPANIYLREDGSPVLLDFGAAREAMEGSSSAMTMIVTPGYAPMEQYTRDERQGPWSDLYALGATLFHCLAGRPPMAAPDRLSHRMENRPDPLERHFDVLAERHTPSFIVLLRDLMSLAISERPKNADEVLARLSGMQTVAGDSLLLDLRATRVPPPAPPSGAMSRSASSGPVSRQPASGPASVDSLPSGPVPASHLSVGQLQRIAHRAGGVVAEQAVVPAIQRSGTADEVIDHLLEFIGDEEERRKFRHLAQVLVKAAARGASVSQVPASVPVSALRAPPAPAGGAPTVFAVPSGSVATQAGAGGVRTIDESFLTDVEQRLAEALGPIARMLVQRAAARAGSHAELVQLLATELDDDAERARFTQGLL